jgi:hypothetical protein
MHSSVVIDGIEYVPKNEKQHDLNKPSVNNFKDDDGNNIEYWYIFMNPLRAIVAACRIGDTDERDKTIYEFKKAKKPFVCFVNMVKNSHTKKRESENVSVYERHLI